MLLPETYARSCNRWCRFYGSRRVDFLVAHSHSVVILGSHAGCPTAITFGSLQRTYSIRTWNISVPTRNQKLFFILRPKLMFGVPSLSRFSTPIPTSYPQSALLKLPEKQCSENCLRLIRRLHIRQTRASPYAGVVAIFASNSRTVPHPYFRWQGPVKHW